MKKIMIKLILCMSFIFLSASNAYAGYVAAKIDNILFYESGNLLYIYPEGGTNAMGVVGCHGANGDYIAYKMSRPFAKEYFSALLMASAANKTVEFWYNNACTDQSVAVTLNYFRVH